MKFCSECGSNVEGKKFCSECGNPVIDEKAPSEPTPKVTVKTVDPNIDTKRKIKRNNWILLICTLAVACFAASWSNLSSTHSGSSSTLQTSVKQPTESEFKASCVAQQYANLARTPDSYKNMKVVIIGKVVQVMEKSDGAQYRVAVDGNYDQMFYVDYTGSFGPGRILENDTVTLWGTYNGLMTYNSTIGGRITIPSLIAKYYQIV